MAKFTLTEGAVLKTQTIQKLIISLGLVMLMAMFAGCSGKPSPWTKKESPWGQSGKSLGGEAPAAEEYKDDLAAPADDMIYGDPVDPYASEPAPMGMVDQAPADGDIMSLPSNYYAVQVMASVDIDRVYKFAERNQLSVRYVIPTLRDGVTWHVLLLDVYPDFAAAKAGAAEMEGLLPTKPWIRKVGSIQKLVP